MDGSVLNDDSERPGRGGRTPAARSSSSSSQPVAVGCTRSHNNRNRPACPPPARSALPRCDALPGPARSSCYPQAQLACLRQVRRGWRGGPGSLAPTQGRHRRARFERIGQEARRLPGGGQRPVEAWQGGRPGRRRRNLPLRRWAVRTGSTVLRAFEYAVRPRPARRRRNRAAPRLLLLLLEPLCTFHLPESTSRPVARRRRRRCPPEPRSSPPFDAGEIPAPSSPCARWRVPARRRRADAAPAPRTSFGEKARSAVARTAIQGLGAARLVNPPVCAKKAVMERFGAAATRARSILPRPRPREPASACRACSHRPRTP